MTPFVSYKTTNLNLLSAGRFLLSEKMRIFSQDEGTRKTFTDIACWMMQLFKFPTSLFLPWDFSYSYFLFVWSLYLDVQSVSFWKLSYFSLFCIKNCSAFPEVQVLEKLQAVVVLSDQKVRDAYQPTMYGRLLVSLPVSLESAIFVIHGANSGYFRESVVLGAIMDTTPFPILQPFGQQVQVRSQVQLCGCPHISRFDPFSGPLLSCVADLFSHALLWHAFLQYRLNLHCYYQEEGEMGTGGSPMHTSVLLANLHAYEFWQRTFKVGLPCWIHIWTCFTLSVGQVPVRPEIAQGEI